MMKQKGSVTEVLKTQLGDCTLVVALDFSPDGLGPLMLAGIAQNAKGFEVRVVVMSGTKEDEMPDWAKLAEQIPGPDTVPLDKLSIAAGPTPPDAVVPGMWKLLQPYFVQSAMSAAALADANGGQHMIGLGGPVREGKA